MSKLQHKLNDKSNVNNLQSNANRTKQVLKHIVN